MKNGKFDVGTIIKGKGLKGEILCKVISEDMVMRGFQYKMGMNEDVQPMATKGSCAAGLHFCFIQNVCEYLPYGSKLALISIPDDEDVYVDNNKFRTHKLDIKRIMLFGEVETWMYLCKNGADVTARDNNAIGWASENGYLEVVKYLHENGADVTAEDNYAVRYAAENGHLEVVKYLHENGADITANDNYVVICAAENGYLDIVKYLHENGADVTAGNNYAVRWAARNGYLEVVKYLYQNGADITADNNYAVRWAAKNGHLEIVKYLQANM